MRKKIFTPESFGIGLTIKVNSDYMHPICKSRRIFSINNDDKNDNKFVINIETENNIILYNVITEIKEYEEYSNKYYKLEAYYDEPLIVFNKKSNIIETNINDKLEDFLKNVNNYEQILIFIHHIIFRKNKFVWYFLQKRIEIAVHDMDFVKNLQLIKIIKDNTLDKLESVIKTMGEDFAYQNLATIEFKQSKKLTSSMKLPLDVINFLKDNNSLYDDFRIICKNDPNEGLYLLDWYNKWDLKMIPTKLNQYFDRFVNIIALIKKLNENIKLYDLIPYIVKQNFMMNNPYKYYSLRNKIFVIPCQAAQTYYDYINMQKGKDNYDYYPSILELEHNVAVRNNKIFQDQKTCDLFNKMISKYDKYTFKDKDYLIRAPKNANEMIEEGNNLHHCVGTYIPLIISNATNVFFLRKINNIDESFITIEINNSGKLIQIKEKFDKDVDDDNIENFLKKWKVYRRKEGLI